MEDDLMIQTDLATDQEVEPANPIQVLLLTNQMILISEIDEVIADIGQPDCKLTSPYKLDEFVVEGKEMSPWLGEVTDDVDIMICSDKILTLVEPHKTLVDSYLKLATE